MWPLTSGPVFAQTGVRLGLYLRARVEDLGGIVAERIVCATTVLIVFNGEPFVKIAEAKQKKLFIITPAELEAEVTRMEQLDASAVTKVQAVALVARCAPLLVADLSLARALFPRALIFPQTCLSLTLMRQRVARLMIMAI